VTSPISRGLPLAQAATPRAAVDVPASAADVPASRWRDAAVCRQADPELFFPIGSTGRAEAEISAAKAVCARCPVRRPCLTFALHTAQQFGIWGGCDETERRMLHLQLRGLGAARGADRPHP
jgi:WhiB family transcriptional regulator, redox-sensing transcriptional regulator